MSTWEVIKSLLKGTRFYRRQAVFLGVVIVTGLLIYLGWLVWGRSEAAVAFQELPIEAFATKTTQIEVRTNGDVFIDGVKHNEALQFYQKNDELRIKIFDNSGEYIPSFKATILLPSPVNENQIHQIVYAVHGVGSYSTDFEPPQTLVYEAVDISPASTFTIVAELPKGLVTPNLWQRIKIAVSQLPVSTWLFVAIILPGITLIVLLVMVLKRRAAQFLPIKGLLGGPPEDIPPAVSGVLIDGVVGAREIAATLIDLARRGYIFIVNKGGGQFTFGIRKTGDIATMPGLTDYEKELLTKIFMPKQIKSSVGDVEMRIGRHIFSRKIAQFYLGVYNEATKEGFFVNNPNRVHLIWKNTGLVLFFVCFFGFMLGAVKEMDPKYGLFFWIGGMLASYVIIKLSPFMPARTDKGTQGLREWLEFREFLIDKRPATGVAQLQNKFEEYLPYAIVLGAEVDWAKRFSRERFNKPDWYESSEQAITLESFANQLYPIIGYVAQNLARSHEPTVE